MKIATNIILIAIALYLSIEVLSKIDKSKVDGIKNTFTVEEVVGNNYTLIPKRYGLDTLHIYGVQRIQEFPMQGRFGTHFYKAFLSNNEILNIVDTEDYEVK